MQPTDPRVAALFPKPMNAPNSLRLLSCLLCVASLFCSQPGHGQITVSANAGGGVSLVQRGVFHFVDDGWEQADIWGYSYQVGLTAERPLTRSLLVGTGLSWNHISAAEDWNFDWQNYPLTSEVVDYHLDYQIDYLSVPAYIG